MGEGRLLLMLALADWGNDQGKRIYPSIAQAAAKTRQDPRTVQRQLRKLEEDGWVELVKKGGGRNNTNEYRIVLEKVALCRPLLSTGVALDAINPGVGCLKPRQAMPPEPLEPLLTVKTVFKKPDNPDKRGKSPAVLEILATLKNKSPGDSKNEK